MEVRLYSLLTCMVWIMVLIKMYKLSLPQICAREITNKTEYYEKIAVVIIRTMSGCRREAEHLTSSFLKLLGWKPGRYLFIPNMSGISEPGGGHSSPDQTTTDVHQFEGTPLVTNTRPLIPSEESSPLAADLILGSHHHTGCIHGYESQSTWLC